MNNSNKVVAWGIIISLALAVINAIGVFGSENDGVYTLAGLGMFIFGIWASVKLFKS